MDTITDTSGTDKIVFGNGIAQANTTYARTGNDLVISVSGTQVARIAGHFTGTGAVETLQFSNGTTVNLPTLDVSINGTSGNDTLNGTAAADTVNGFAGDDVISGGDANDILNGGAGNDIVVSRWTDRENGNDMLIGGTGQILFMAGSVMIYSRLQSATV